MEGAMKIIFFEAEDVEKKILLDLYGDIDYDTEKCPLNADNVGKYADVEVISCFIYSDLSRDVLMKLKNLKFIATRSRTFDHIDLEYCNQNGIAVANVPAYGADTVSEHVFALLLALSRHIPQAAQRTREGDFLLQGLQGFDLRGKTMGIIGTGAIGLRTASIAKAFGMNVLGYDLIPRHLIAEAAGLTYTSLDKLLVEADIISLHVTSTQEARALLSEKEFSLMKTGVVIINTSTGAAIDVKALVKALADGKVGAVGLDVLPDESAIHEDAEFLRETFSMKHDAETILASHALLHHKNVIVTPHIAFYTRETIEGILRATGDNIQSFQSGHHLNVVNKPVMPVSERKAV
jgi:D-lactate dehydrogenase